MTDKHTAEHSKTACLGVDWPVCDVRNNTQGHKDFNLLDFKRVRDNVSCELYELPQICFDTCTQTPPSVVIWG